MASGRSGAGLPETALSFEAETHSYWLCGAALPSVTQIMQPMSLMLYRNVPGEALAAAADRGSRAHEQVSNYIRYGILETDEDTQGYIGAFTAFERAHKPTWAASEYLTHHRLLRYAGTADLLGRVGTDGSEGFDLVDLKCTSAFYPIMLATQLAGYAEALKSQGVKVRARYGLQLMKDGRYRFEPMADGYKTFLHCLAIYNEIMKEGV